MRPRDCAWYAILIVNSTRTSIAFIRNRRRARAGDISQTREPKDEKQLRGDCDGAAAAAAVTSKPGKSAKLITHMYTRAFGTLSRCARLSEPFEFIRIFIPACYCRNSHTLGFIRVCAFFALCIREPHIDTYLAVAIAFEYTRKKKKIVAIKRRPATLGLVLFGGKADWSLSDRIYSNEKKIWND